MSRGLGDVYKRQLSDVPSASLVQRTLSELLGVRGVVAPDRVDVA